MPLGNPIRKQNESRMVSVLATEGQTVFTVQGGYIINQISVFRNGVRLSNSEDFTAGDGSTVTLNNAANIDDRIEFHIFDRFTVQNAIVSAASTQTISGDVVVNGKIFGNLDVPSINTGIVTTQDLNVTGVGTFTGAIDANGGATIDNIQIGVANDNEINTSTGQLTLDSALGQTVVDDRLLVTGISTFTGLVDANGGAHIDNLRLGIDADNDITTSSGNLTLDSAAGNVVINDNLDVDGITTLDGVVSIADSIVHTGDTNTAIRFPAADTITAETGGSESFRVDSSQRLLLGHTSSQTIGSNSHGRSQINVTGNQPVLTLSRFENVSAGPNLVLGKSRAGSAGSYTVVQDDDGLGSISFAGADGTDLVTVGAIIEAQVDGTPGSNDMPGRLIFSTTADDASSPTERLRITSAGRIGINSTSPTYALEVDGGTQNTVIVARSSDAKAAISFLDNTTSGYGYATIGGEGDEVYITSGTGVERLRITSDGRIGMHDSSPNDYEVDIMKRSTATDAQIRLYNNATGSSNDTIMRYQIAGTSASNYIYFGDGDDTNVGQIRYNHNSNFLSIHTNAAERLRIDSSGQMGLGMTPTRMFEVKDSTGANRIANIRGTGASGAYLAFLDQNTTDDSKCRVGSAGGNNLVMRGDTVQFATGAGAEFGRFDGSGHLLLGTTTGGLTDYGDMLTIAGANAGMTLRCDATSQVSHIYFADGTSSTAQYAGYVQYHHNTDDMKFGTSAVTRFTIDTDGAITAASNKGSAHNQFYSYSNGGDYEQTFRISNASGGSSANMRLLLTTYSNQGADPYVKFDSGGTNFVVGQRWAGTTSNSLVLGRGENPSGMDAQLLMKGDGDFFVGSNGDSVTSTSGFYINASGNASSSVDNGYIDHRRRVGSGNAVIVHRGTQGQLQIHGDGDCENTNNNYTGISDVSLKENIVDASSQWDDIKAVKVRKFNFKSETGYSTDTHIGVVAQELELVSPNLVKETRKDPDPKATDTSTIKSVKYSILYMKSVKALQEAMARIETLEAKVTALEGS